MIVCVLIPRFALTTAAGDRAELLSKPVALAPEPGGVQQVGEVSLAAEAFGIHAGMRLGEALARCPELTLMAPDPAGVADLWERLLVALESIGAAVEPERPGLACFSGRGLLRLHGGIDGLLRAVRTTLRVPARIGVAPTRFAAVAAATRSRPRRPELVGVSVPARPSTGGGSVPARPATLRDQAGTAALRDDPRGCARTYLAPLPVALLRARPALAQLPEALERLGIATLGEFASLSPEAVADRFGATGLVAHDLAGGGDTPLRPRTPGEVLRESLELPEAASGLQLEHGLGLLVDRLLSRRERDGRTLRSVVVSAALVEHGGTWRQPVVFREALADPTRMRLALTPHLARIPAPSHRLGLAVERFGPASADQRALIDDPSVARRGRLREAVRQARAAAGPDAALRVLSVDPGSRVPERRSVLTPFEG